MLRVDIDDWVLSGGGVNGVSYFHKTDSGMMLKFPNADATEESMQKEIDVSQTAYDMGVPTPEPGCVVTDGKRFGQMFHRITDKMSYSKAAGLYPQNIPAYAHEYASIVKSLHRMRCDRTKMRNVKDLYRNAIEKNEFRDDMLKSKAVKLLETLPDADTCLHGDLHFGNVIFDGSKSYFIDMSDFCYGYPIFDLSMMRVLYKLAVSGPKRFNFLYHCTAEQCLEFIINFEREYFGPDYSQTEIDEIMKPYCALRVLYMEWEMGGIIPSPVSDDAFSIFNK